MGAIGRVSGALKLVLLEPFGGGDVEEPGVVHVVVDPEPSL